MTVNRAPADSLDRIDVVALFLSEHGAERELGHAKNAVHRRADFVTHVGQKRTLGLIGRLRRVLCFSQLVYCLLSLGNVIGNP